MCVCASYLGCTDHELPLVSSSSGNCNSSSVNQLMALIYRDDGLAIELDLEQLQSWQPGTSDSDMRTNVNNHTSQRWSVVDNFTRAEDNVLLYLFNYCRSLLSAALCK